MSFPGFHVYTFTCRIAHIKHLSTTYGTANVCPLRARAVRFKHLKNNGHSFSTVR